MINFDYLYDKNYYGDKLYENHFYGKKLHFRIIDNGTVLPYKIIQGNPWGVGGIVDANNDFVPTSFVHNGRGDAYTPNEKIMYSPETVVYLDMLHDVWGHCITDNLKRFWFLESDDYKRNFQNCKIIYTLTGGGDKLKNFVELSNILGVKLENFYQLIKPVKFNQIILPDQSFFYNTIEDSRRFTDEYFENIERIRHFALKNRTPTNLKKIYLFYGRDPSEQLIAKYFQEKGYAIIRPEMLSLKDQLNLFINCESFASTVGSCAHNMIFTRNNTEIILIPRTFHFNIYQAALNDLHEKNIIYINSDLAIFAQTIHGPYCYIISNQLKKFFNDSSNDKYKEESIINFVNYVNFSKRNGLKENTETLNYYLNPIQEFLETHKKIEKI